MSQFLRFLWPQLPHQLNGNHDPYLEGYMISFIHSFIHTFKQRSLSIYYVPGPDLGTEDTAVNKTDVTGYPVKLTV